MNKILQNLSKIQNFQNQLVAPPTQKLSLEELVFRARIALDLKRVDDLFIDTTPIKLASLFGKAPIQSTTMMSQLLTQLNSELSPKTSDSPLLKKSQAEKQVESATNVTRQLEILTPELQNLISKCFSTKAMNLNSQIRAIRQFIRDPKNKGLLPALQKYMETVQLELINFCLGSISQILRIFNPSSPQSPTRQDAEASKKFIDDISKRTDISVEVKVFVLKLIADLYRFVVCWAFLKEPVPRGCEKPDPTSGIGFFKSKVEWLIEVCESYFLAALDLLDSVNIDDDLLKKHLSTLDCIESHGLELNHHFGLGYRCHPLRLRVALDLACFYFDAKEAIHSAVATAEDALNESLDCLQLHRYIMNEPAAQRSELAAQRGFAFEDVQAAIELTKENLSVWRDEEYGAEREI